MEVVHDTVSPKGITAGSGGRAPAVVVMVVIVMVQFHVGITLPERACRCLGALALLPDCARAHPRPSHFG